jgi:hypothetical protein
LLIEAELTADYADVADNPARLNLETRKPRRKYKDNESGKQEKRNLDLLKHPQISQIESGNQEATKEYTDNESGKQEKGTLAWAY